MARSEAWTEALGMMLVALASLSVSSLMILFPVMQRLGLPYYKSLGAVQLLLTAGFAGVAWRSGDAARMEAGKCKWVFLRGLTGAGLGVLGLVAMGCGARAGDVNALQCINVVVAALLGRVFLGERLRALNAAAISLSLVGAVCVTEAYTVVHPSPEGPPPPWAGYALACASGATSGLTFFAGRKSKGVSVFVVSASVCLQEGVIMLLLPRLGLVQDAPLDAILRSPWLGLGCFALAGDLFTLAVLCTVMGSSRCPAAASSTIYTSVGMSSAYGGQVLVFGQVPGPITLFGAVLMLLSVACTAVAGARYKPGGANAESCMELRESAATVSRKSSESFEAPDNDPMAGKADRMLC